MKLSRMVDKMVLPLALAAALLGGVSVWSAPSADAAKCTAGNGASCEGECCKANATECLAEPCPKAPVGPAPELPGNIAE
jgi:hypothetical protein